MNDEIIQDVNSPFFIQLKNEVDQYFTSRKISMKGNDEMKIKTFALILLYFFSCILLYLVPTGTLPILLVYLLMGLCSSLVMLNISHEATHEVIFESHFLNRLMSYTFNLMGSNEYVWRITHNIAHHPYPNVPETDPDIDQGPLVRLSPSVPLYKFHKFQHYYAPIVYSLFSLYLVFIKDFRLLFGMKIIGQKKYEKHPVKEIIILFSSKIIFLGYILILPIILLPVSWGILFAGYMIYSFLQSTILTALTAPVHVTEDTSFKYKYVDEQKVTQDWAARQVETTTDFIVKNPLIDLLLGGSNYQVIHHLFPQICHIHFRDLNTILQKNAVKYKIHYMHEPLSIAYLSHLKKLKYFGSHKE